MALTDSFAAYADCFRHFEKAEASSKGIRILMASEKEAYHLRFRLYHARKLERREARRMYPKEDIRYSKSTNDKFRIRVLPSAEDDGKAWVYIEPWDQEIEEVEEL